MKTTVEIPEKTLKRARTLAAAKGLSLEQLVAEAIEDKIGRGESKSVRIVLPITPQFLQVAAASKIGVMPDPTTDPPAASPKRENAPQQAKPAKRN